MELHQLRYFLAAAEAGSMSRAAGRCNVAQPSLSQQIKKLEEELGVRLFDRFGRGVVLTEAGLALVPRARRILAEVGEVESRLAADGAVRGGRLIVGAIPTMAPYLLPPVLAELREVLPACEVQVREDLTENLLELLVDCVIDVAVVSTPIDQAHVEVEVIGDEAFLAVLPAYHRLSRAGTITVAELGHYPRVSLQDVHCLGRQINEFCAARRIASVVACQAAQIATVLELVRLGLGVSLVPAMAARRDESPERCYLPLRRSGPRREIALAWRAGRTRERPAERFADILRARLGELVDFRPAGATCG
ncbi:MAG TPA: LysR substrate-binding domain-containing protein [Candidatus Krumholzibacteria bacterium]|nr:LysR substrate-binding domain-containing protein [Candidatus Krumholzibacteria bacterium]HPD72367.1 LysR substrate-binding domain-containing protein [Candidatus Krumholzibacteria bacterium]HRY40701.1 LysR substrate-binding domain-containing protein [Candidatus Krumholzibacteria bacterium]